MQCDQCQSRNEPGRKFCGTCGAELFLVCPACDFNNKTDDLFCGGCGKKLTRSAIDIDRAPEVPKKLEQDIRRVTIWFCDIAGFTTLSNSHDAETIHSLLEQFFEGIDGIVHSFGGTIDKHIGDNVMALFGAPVAHENDPERGVCAALSAHDWVKDLSTTLSIDIRVHIGIATGRVVAGGSGSAHHQAYTVIGDSVNLASRLEGLAKAGETVISDGIKKAIGSTIKAEDIGSHEIKGFSKPVNVWRVLPETKYNPLNDTTEGIFVGREEEIKIFQEALKKINNSSSGSVFYIRAHAGMGKSRLLQKFLVMGKEYGFDCHKLHNLSFGMGTERSTLRIMVSELIGFDLSDPEDSQHVAIKTFVQSQSLNKKDESILYDIFGTAKPLENKLILDAMTSEMRFQAKIEFVCNFITKLSAKTPQIFAFEDLHFADETSLTLLKKLFEKTTLSRIILIASSRIDVEVLEKEFWTQDSDQSSVHVLDLKPLTSEEAYQVAKSELSANENILQKCVERAEGNPLFLDQLLRNADETFEEGAVPSSIETMMIARVDRLPTPERKALKMASVYGQWFTLEMVDHLLGASNTLFNAALASYLIRPENSGFIFTHSMLQEAIYNSYLSRQKKDLHDQAADWYSGKDMILEARHLDRSENPRAPGVYFNAAEDCKERFEFTNGLPLAERGIELAEQMPEKYRLTCLQAFMTREIGKSEEAIQLYKDAIKMIEEEELHCEAWIGIAACNRWMGKGEESFEVLKQTEKVAKSNDLPLRLTQVGYYRGSYLFTRNELDRAETSYQSGLDNAKQCSDKLWAARNLSGLADCYYAGLQMSKALFAFRECLDIANEEGFGRIEVANRYMTGLTRRYLNEMREALDDVLTAKQLAIEVGHRRSEMYSTNFAAEFLLDMGRVDEAIDASTRTVEVTHLTGNERFRAYAMNQLARGLMASGEHEKAIEILEEGIQISRQVGMSFVGPRLLGTLSICSKKREVQRSALEEGSKILRSGCHAHNQLWFLRDAIESALISDERELAVEYSDWLEKITETEPLPWSNYFIGRARAIVRHRQDPKDRAGITSLTQLTKLAKEVGFAEHSMS